MSITLIDPQMQTKKMEKKNLLKRFIFITSSFFFFLETYTFTKFWFNELIKYCKGVKVKQITGAIN